eukprot:scaffold1675_cov90-Amphora_coffeaeformis.AAC.1
MRKNTAKHVVQPGNNCVSRCTLFVLFCLLCHHQTNFGDFTEKRHRNLYCTHHIRVIPSSLLRNGHSLASESSKFV